MFYFSLRIIAIIIRWGFLDNCQLFKCIEDKTSKLTSQLFNLYHVHNKILNNSKPS